MELLCLVTTLDEAVSSAGDALVVIDYSTTWWVSDISSSKEIIHLCHMPNRCGPCKLVMPKYVELSDKYEKVIFLKCIGDSSKEAGALMKREGVRSVPTFHFWKGGSKIEVVSGARIEDVEAAILSNQ